MKTESISVGELLNDPANVRQHGARNLETIKASLARFGQQKPIVVDGNGVVVAGNGTLAAARELGWQEVHVVRSGLTGSDRTAYAIADNRTAELAEWDDAALAEQLSALAIDDAELLAAAGYDPGELEALADAVVGGGEVVEDEAPEPPTDPVTKPGDLWQLGEHRVLCGDSTKAEDVARLMGGARADMVFTDPPYAIYGSSTGIASDIADDKMIRPFFRDVVLAARATLKLFGHAYICCDWRSWSSWWEVSKGTGLAGKNMIVWDKGGGLGAMYANCHELVFFASSRPTREKMTQKITGERLVSGPNVWRINRASGAETGGVRKHNAQKPIKLMSIAIEKSSDHGQLVADFFLGSGSTLIAAEQLGRRCYGIEISPAYCDVIVERWENLTGKKAKRVADG